MLRFIIFILLGGVNTPYLLPVSAAVAPFNIDEIVEPSKKETLTFTEELSKHLIETVNALAATNNQIDWKEVAKVMAIKAGRPVIAAQCRDRWNKYDNPELYHIDFSLEDNNLILQELIKKTTEGHSHAEVGRMLSSQFNLKLAPGNVQAECRKQRKILLKENPSILLPKIKRTKRGAPAESTALVTLPTQPTPHAGGSSAPLTPLVSLDPFTSPPFGDLGFDLFSADDPFMLEGLTTPDHLAHFDMSVYGRMTPALEGFLG
jgi:hypothetical protein